MITVIRLPLDKYRYNCLQYLDMCHHCNILLVGNIHRSWHIFHWSNSNQFDHKYMQILYSDRYTVHFDLGSTNHSDQPVSWDSPSLSSLRPTGSRTPDLGRDCLHQIRHTRQYLVRWQLRFRMGIARGNPIGVYQNMEFDFRPTREDWPWYCNNTLQRLIHLYQQVRRGTFQSHDFDWRTMVSRMNHKAVKN